MFRLKWQDLDFQRGFIKLIDPKGGRDSQIPMNDSALNLFRDHPRTESEYVFPGKKGGPRTDIKRALTRIKKATGLPDDFAFFMDLDMFMPPFWHQVDKWTCFIFRNS